MNKKADIPDYLIANPNDEKALERGYYYDPEPAKRVIWFIENFILHIKGEIKPFILEDWQRKLIHRIYGWRRPDGRRRFKTVWFEIGRGNGKSKLTFALGLYHLIADGVSAAEVYYYAANASLGTQLFAEVLNTVQECADLRSILSPFKRELRFDKNNSVFRVVNAESSNAHGTNPSTIIIDEVHTLADKKVLEGLLTGMNKRGNDAQPLILYATTAGFPNSVYEELHDYAVDVQSGDAEDLHYLPLIYAVPPYLDWREEENWVLANPNLGVSIDLETMREDCAKAQLSMSDQLSFRRLHLNQIIQKENKWINLAQWDACEEKFPANFDGCLTCAGVDLSNTTDITAVVYAHYNPQTEQTFIVPKFYLPEATVMDFSKKNTDIYQKWSKSGLLKLIPGKTIKLKVILDDIIAENSKKSIHEIALDPWQAIMLAEELADNGLKTIRFNQSHSWYTTPCKVFEGMLANKTISHDGNELLRWMVDNAVLSENARGECMIDKQSSSEKIDGVCAMIMSIDRIIRNKNGFSKVEEKKPTYLARREIIYI